MAPVAAGTPSGGARCSGSAARTEIRQNYRGPFCVAVARQGTRSGESREDSPQFGGNKGRTKEKARERKETQGQGGWRSRREARKIKGRSSWRSSCAGGKRETRSGQRDGSERRRGRGEG